MFLYKDPIVSRAPLADTYASLQRVEEEKPKPSCKTAGYLAVATLVAVAVAAYFMREENTPAGIVSLMAGIGFLGCCIEATRRSACKEPNSVV